MPQVREALFKRSSRINRVWLFLVIFKLNESSFQVCFGCVFEIKNRTLGPKIKKLHFTIS